MTAGPRFLPSPMEAPNPADSPDGPEPFCQGTAEPVQMDELDLLPLARAEVAVFIAELEAMAAEQDKPR